MVYWQEISTDVKKQYTFNFKKRLQKETTNWNKDIYKVSRTPDFFAPTEAEHQPWKDVRKLYAE